MVATQERSAALPTDQRAKLDTVSIVDTPAAPRRRWWRSVYRILAETRPKTAGTPALSDGRIYLAGAVDGNACKWCRLGRQEDSPPPLRRQGVRSCRQGHTGYR